MTTDGRRSGRLAGSQAELRRQAPPRQRAECALPLPLVHGTAGRSAGQIALEHARQRLGTVAIGYEPLELTPLPARTSRVGGEAAADDAHQARDLSGIDAEGGKSLFG